MLVGAWDAHGLTRKGMDFVDSTAGWDTSFMAKGE